MQWKVAGTEDRARFNDFIARFSWGDLLQSWEWGDLKARAGWKPIRLIAERDGETIAAVSLLKRAIPKTGRCILYASRGPVLDTKDADLVRSFTDAMKQAARQHGAILIKIDPPVDIEDTVSDANLRAVGFRPIAATGFGGTQPKCVMQLDLAGRTEDELLASFHEKWRYNIRLAGRKGVTVRHGGREEISAFYALLRETTERDGFLVRSEKYFLDMWDCLSPAGFARVSLAYFEGEPIAGVFNYVFGDKACYLYGASSNRNRNVMAPHLLQWEMIRQAKEQGCKWYDFRGVSPKKGTGDAHLEGLNRFKEGFRPRFVEYVGEYDLVLSPVWYWGWTRALPRIRTALKNRNRVPTKQVQEA
ncbi:MAG: peptidoglycan bridge formation glycyltransferase FemA/FemB family protein [Capsulimonadales bacterium]|nr:peptidoglycan bridge formation glycyltransferase FemA/FemB family protein [Capsulimonadales bacterium]